MWPRATSTKHAPLRPPPPSPRAEKECGLHSGNVKKADGTVEERKAERDLWIEGKVKALTKAQVQELAGGKRDKDTLLVLYAPWCTFCQVRRSVAL